KDENQNVGSRSAQAMCSRDSRKWTGLPSLRAGQPRSKALIDSALEVGLPLLLLFCGTAIFAGLPACVQSSTFSVPASPGVSNRYSAGTTNSASTDTEISPN